MLASSEGHLNVVKWLLAAGANADFRNGDGITALMLACAGGHHAAAQELAGHVATLDSADQASKLPLKRPVDLLSLKDV